ncbi:MAG: Ig-like domain-containing protein [Verrucomicrobiota bacterium]
MKLKIIIAAVLLAVSHFSPARAATILQGAAATYAAFEADTTAKIIAGTPETWVSTNDAAASGGRALYADGVNATATSPHSFAQYQIKFATVGTYYLYSRWKADPSRTGGDAFTANSSRFPLTFGTYSTPGDAAPFYTSASNAGSAPTDNVYDWSREPDGNVYPVAVGDLAAPLVFTIGTREAGMFIDRFVFSTEPALSDAQLDALSNSGVPAAGPQIKKAVGSATLTTVTVTFTRPLAANTVSGTNFTVSGGVTVSSAVQDANDPRIVVLTTTPQTAGTAYILTVNNVTDTSGSPIAVNANISFTAWKVVTGWALKEIYFGITGSAIADLTAAPNYPANPDRVEWVKGVQLNRDPYTDNYGARLTTFFTPQANGAYEFYMYNDDEAELSLSPNDSSAGLVSFGTFPSLAGPFADPPIGTSPSLASGSRYLLQGQLKQGAGDVYINVAARLQGSGTPPASLPVLGGNQIATWVNPDLGVVTFDQQPANVTATVGGRARFAVKVTTAENPVYFQWRVNGTPIPGATLRAYVTPVLSTADSGKTYDVVVSVAGRDTTSASATLTVVSGQLPSVRPYLGMNLVGGGTFGGASLSPVDVAGVVQQENWNNLNGFTFSEVALLDAAGAATPVTFSTDAAPNAPTEVWYTGTKSVNDGDALLMQGFVDAGASIDPIIFRLNNVPAGVYNLLVYSVGFDFTPNYLQAYEVTGAGSYPTYHARAETGIIYANNPAYRRMTTTTTNAPALGNYVQFDGVSPAGDGSLAVSVTWEPQDASISNGHSPAINAIQLVRVFPSLTISRSGGNITIAWPNAASGSVLESSLTLGPTASWSIVAGSPNPITGAGSILATPAGRFYRLRKL